MAIVFAHVIDKMFLFQLFRHGVLFVAEHVLEFTLV